MAISKFHLMAAAAVLGVLPVGAQMPGNPDDEVVFESGVIELVRTTPELKEILDQARPVEPNAIPTPKFALRTRDNSFVLSIGGQINPILGYDIGNDLYNSGDAGSNFITGNIPVPAQTGHKGAFFINPLNAFVDFTVVGFGGTANQVTGYVKIGMNGSSNTAFLKRAYITWRGFTVGENATLMSDGLAQQPPTIDTEGPCGDVAATAYQVAYKSPSFNGFGFAVGLEMPTFYSSNGFYRGKDYRHDYFGVKVTDEVTQLVPDIPFWIQYQPSDQNRVRFTGMLRNFAYRDLVSAKTRNVLGWGAMVSGNFSFWKPITFNFQAVYGKGIANYIQDIAGRRLSFTPDDDNVGRMTANPMMGLVFGASYNATSKLQFNVVGSYSRIWNVGDYAVVDDSNGVAGSDNYRYATYVAANCFYNITSYLQWGVEYLYGHRQTYGLGGANDSRIQTQLSFTF